MNQVNLTDVTFLTLALGDFSGIPAALQAHDFYVSLGLLIVGVALVVCYHKYGSATS